MSYKISETFLTFQGEGVHMGKSAYFVRLMGCDVQCPFCDSAATWHKNWKPKDALSLSAAQIVALVQNNAPPGAIVVITGGEPTLYKLWALTDALHDAQFRVHLETAGHRPMSGSFEWITLSPKTAIAPPLEANLSMANEIKIIVESEATLLRDLQLVIPAAWPAASIWLHPEWSHRNDPNVLRLIVETVKWNPRLRVGYQMHKIYGADLLDPNADKRIVPLGGKA